MSLAMQLSREPEPVFQLLYISAASRAFTQEELAELLAKARQNNESMNVSGMLLYHQDSFIQVLEGPREQVEALYNKIGQDKRHTETRIIQRGFLPQRDFKGWSMGYYKSESGSTENMDGFHQFLKTGFPSDDIGVYNSEARSALLDFRQGMWHQKVET